MGKDRLSRRVDELLKQEWMVGGCRVKIQHIEVEKGVIDLTRDKAQIFINGRPVTQTPLTRFLFSSRSIEELLKDAVNDYSRIE